MPDVENVLNKNSFRGEEALEGVGKKNRRGTRFLKPSRVHCK